MLKDRHGFVMILLLFVSFLLINTSTAKAAPKQPTLTKFQQEQIAVAEGIINKVWGDKVTWGNQAARIRKIDIIYKPKDKVNGLLVYLRNDGGLTSSFIWKAFTKKCVESIPKLFADPKLKNITDVGFVGAFPVIDKYGQSAVEDVTRLIISRNLAAKIKWEYLTTGDVANLLEEEDDGDFWINPALLKK